MLISNQADLERTLRGTPGNAPLSLCFYRDPPGIEAMLRALPPARVAAIDLCSCRDAAVTALCEGPSLPHLSKLSLSVSGGYQQRAKETKVGPEAFESIATWAGLRHLEVLDLSLQPVGDAGAKALGRADLSSLASLALFGARIGEEGAKAIAANPTLTRLERLDLGGERASPWSRANRIGSEGLAALARSPVLDRMLELRLSHNDIDDTGVAALATAPWSSALRDLDLSGNPGIEDAGAKALATGRRLSSMRRLDLNGTQIKLGGARALASSPFLRKLKRLGLIEAGMYSERTESSYDWDGQECWYPSQRRYREDELRALIGASPRVRLF